MEKTNREIIESILVEIKPNLKKKIKNKKLNLIHEGLIDSFDIIQLIIKIEKQTKKKIKLVKFDRSSFATVDQIIKLL
jgi:D-alanine--poly(phosphoribitol) ligase subunit 2